ncbi:hypothetical protein [uncultured Paraglaciecola sp.]|uniref:hypothetical protein n=1 Tax=uncultured Paraglaciecola sp. TaxID=1765024 RepID=UPI0025F79B32|nr:hypothetical protein [uncultured Paraglaciecola sp.]
MFNQHGGFKVTLVGDIVLVVVTGAWNAETAKAYSEVFLEIISPIKDKPWGLISDVMEWELCTPDCELLIVQLSVECKRLGMKREAIINTNIESVKLDLFHKYTKKQPSKALPDVFERRFFKTDSEAKEWLKNEGYGLT